MTETLRQRLQRHEGLRLRPYNDSLGIATIGYGHNLQSKGISEKIADAILDEDIAEAKEQVAHALPWTLGLDDARREVLEEMAFQLGIQGLLGFKNTLTAIREGRWQDAHDGMLNSQWHHQTPERCEELADIILNP